MTGPAAFLVSQLAPRPLAHAGKVTQPEVALRGHPSKRGMAGWNGDAKTDGAFWK